MTVQHLDPAPDHILGLVVLSTDETLENEARALLAAQPVSLHHSRIFSADTVTPTSLSDMKTRITASAALLPEHVGVVGYACTSASVMIGPDEVAAQVRAGRPGVAVTNPISATCAALDALDARRIGLVTPYVPDVVAPMRAHLARHGVEVVEELSFGEGDDRRVARIPQTVTAQAARDVARNARIDALFLSCTNLRSFGVIEQLEDELKLPVISSNLALLWHMLVLANADTRRPGFGRLFSGAGYV
ncbi:MAG: Asp/Glu racemase [Pseudomonadota bacterium]